jgi:hypothetical protein
MFYLYHYAAEYPVLALIQTALTVWMLVDLSRRAVDNYWFWVVLFFQPVGPWIYFFVVKVKDFHGPSGWTLFHHRPSLSELRYRNQQTPTLANHLELAERLIESDAYAEALPHLEAALAREPDHCLVLYSLALCFTKEGKPEKAPPLLQKVIARDRCWSDYRAWRLLISVRDDLGDGAGALAACRELVRLSPTMQHRCLLAEHLLTQGEAREAEDLLAKAIEEHRFAPGPSRRRNRRWAAEARRLQKEALKSAAVKVQDRA